MEFLRARARSRVGIAGVGFDLQAQLTQAEDREIEAGKRRRLGDAGDMPSQIQMVGTNDMKASRVG